MNNERKLLFCEISFEKNNIFISIVIMAYCLHLFRNISIYYSVVPIISAFIFASIYVLKSNKFDSNGSFFILTFFLTYLFPICYSFYFYPEENYTISIFRYLYLTPFFVFSIFCLRTTKNFIHSLKLFSFFIVLGGLTLFYQLKFGSISWFADASEREGLIRFSSLVGSLTAYGVFSVLALPIIYFMIDNKIVRIISLLIIVFAMLVTLQKAAIANIFLFFCLMIFHYTKKEKIKAIFCTSFLMLILFFISYYLKIPYVIATVDNVFRFNEVSGFSDVNIFDAIVDRLWLLPSHLYELHGFVGILFGVGMVGGSGTLGFPEYPMAHNGFFDLLFIGGVLNLFVFCALISFIVYRLFILKSCCVYKKRSYRLIVCLLWVIFLFIINMAFYGPLHVHPYGGVVFYTIAVFICLKFRELSQYVIVNNK